MKTTGITFLPVGNGDMTLISLGDAAGTNILIDCNIRVAADNPDDNTRDVAKDLRERLKTDENGRPFVNVFLSTHPDKDHFTGLKKHFHLGPIADYADDKKPNNEKRIVIGEIWSSPIVYRRASKNHTLCEDAVAFNKEAKRRVNVAREKQFSGVEYGERILVLGEDEEGKTDDLTPILVKVDEAFQKIGGTTHTLFKARLLAPLPMSSDEEEENALGKNHSSVILNIELADDESRTTVKNYLAAGDAEVLIWQKLWNKHQAKPEVLTYDLLLTPHHCSWHSLSYDSRSEKGEEAKVCEEAKSALSQIRVSGKIVASSKPIENDDCDPPSHAAKREYESIAKGAKGAFFCTGEEPSKDNPAPLEFVLADGVLTRTVKKAAVPAASLLTSGIVDRLGAEASRTQAVQKGGNTRYA